MKCKYNIPVKEFTNIKVLIRKLVKWVKVLSLPYNPEDDSPIIFFVPKRWLRHTPWINYDDYFMNAYVKEGEEDKIERPEGLEYNRYNYDMIAAYI
ncbi:MAG: hypothetical protein ACLUTA_11490 [Blautia wexlerae]